MKRSAPSRLLLPATAFLLFASCCSDDSGETPRPPQPSSYDIFVAGAKRVGTKYVAAVWKNGKELHLLTDGSADAWAYGITLDGATVVTVGCEERNGSTVALLWENNTLKYTLGEEGADSYALAVATANGDRFTAGSVSDGGTLTATVWKNGEPLHRYSLPPATSQARAVTTARGKLYAAGSLQSGTAQPLAQVWEDGEARYTLSDGSSPGDVRSLFADGRELFAAGTVGNRAVVWRNGEPLHVLTDGSLPASALSLWRTDGVLYTAGYVMTPTFEEQGMVWRNGEPYLTLANGSARGSLPSATAAWGDTVFTAGTLLGDERRAVVWQGDRILYMLGPGEAYALYVVPHYD